MYVTSKFFVDISFVDFTCFTFSLPEYEELEWFAKVEDLVLSRLRPWNLSKIYIEGTKDTLQKKKFTYSVSATIVAVMTACIGFDRYVVCMQIIPLLLAQWQQQLTDTSCHVHWFYFGCLWPNFFNVLILTSGWGFCPHVGREWG